MKTMVHLPSRRLDKKVFLLMFVQERMLLRPLTAETLQDMRLTKCNPRESYLA